MNDELAYLFGLIIGGGTLTPGGIDIEFPYKQWLRRDLQITPLLYTSAIQNVTPLIHSELGAWAIPRCIPGRTPRFHIEVTNVPNIFLSCCGRMVFAPLESSENMHLSRPCYHT